MLMYSHKHQKEQKKNLYNVQGQPTLRKEKKLKIKKGKMFKIPLRAKKEKKKIIGPFLYPFAASYPLQSVSALDQKLGNVFIKSTAEKRIRRGKPIYKISRNVEEPAASAGCARNKGASMIWWWHTKDNGTVGAKHLKAKLNNIKGRKRASLRKTIQKKWYKESKKRNRRSSEPDEKNDKTN